MEKLMLTSKLKGMGKEFFLQTSGDPKTGIGTSVLFEDGNPIDFMEFKLPENVNKAAGVLDEYHKNRHERFTQLGELYTELIEETDASILEKLALSLIEHKLFDEALKILSRAIENTPRNPKLHNDIGLTYLALDDYQKAAESFLKAIEFNPELPDFHNNLGRAYLKQGKCFPASKSFQKAIELNVYYAEAYYNKATTIILNGIKKEDYDLAQNLVENAISLLIKASGFDPSFKNDHFQKSLDAIESNDLDSAFVELCKGYDLATKDKFPKRTYHFHLDYMFRHENLREETVINHIKKLNKLLEIHPNYPDFYNELGLAYTVLTQFHSDRAVEAYQKALELNPDYKIALKNLKLVQNEMKGLKTLLKAMLK